MEPTTPRARCIRLLFLTLIPCLVLQLELRSITEPYPAILLPGGANLISDQGSFTARETNLLAEDAEGKQHPVPAAALLDTVPFDYRPYVVARGFGIAIGRDVRSVRVRILGRDLVHQFGRHLTALQIEETRQWVRSRLRRNTGIEAVRIHILVFAVETFPREDPPRVERRLHRMTTVELAGVAR